MGGWGVCVGDLSGTFWMFAYRNWAASLFIFELRGEFIRKKATGVRVNIDSAPMRLLLGESLRVTRDTME